MSLFGRVAESDENKGSGRRRGFREELVAVGAGDSAGDAPEPRSPEPRPCRRSARPPGGSVGQRVPRPGAGLEWWLWAFFCSPSSPLSFYFFIILCSQELQIWANYRFHLSLAALICERVCFWPWCNVLRNRSEEWEQNFFAGGCRVRETLLFCSAQEGSFLSQTTYICPSYTYLQYKMSCGKKKN